MDFSLNEEQLMLEDSVEKFIANDYDFDTRQKYVGSERGFSAEVNFLPLLVKNVTSTVTTP